MSLTAIIAALSRPVSIAFSGRRLAATTIVLAAALSAPGCGDDGDGGFKPENPFRDLTSPENVLHNFEQCFNSRDYEQFAPLLHDEFTFKFDQDDVENCPDVIPHDGLWSRAQMLNAVGKMLDENYAPCDTADTAVGIAMSLAFRDGPEDTAMPGAPTGTLEAFVVLHFSYQTVKPITYLTHSWPLLFFAPDSTHSPVTWHIWRMRDSPYGFLTTETSLASASVGAGGAPLQGVESALGAKPAEIPTPVQGRTFGAHLAFYAAECK